MREVSEAESRWRRGMLLRRSWARQDYDDLAVLVAKWPPGKQTTTRELYDVCMSAGLFSRTLLRPASAPLARRARLSAFLRRVWEKALRFDTGDGEHVIKATVARDGTTWRLERAG